jgi:hypothetical protein
MKSEIKMHKIDYFKLTQWLLFMPLILPLCFITGLFYGFYRLGRMFLGGEINKNTSKLKN